MDIQRIEKHYWKVSRKWKCDNCWCPMYCKLDYWIFECADCEKQFNRIEFNKLKIK